MLKAGNGFFAMWAGIAPDMAAAFELMHARDHLAEHLAYLGEGGILWARRYGEGQGVLPPNFAFYGMRDLDRLTGPGSADRKVFETEFFKAIRPHYRDRIAHHCRVLGSAGAGTGSAAATFLLDLRRRQLARANRRSSDAPSFGHGRPYRRGRLGGADPRGRGAALLSAGGRAARRCCCRRVLALADGGRARLDSRNPRTSRDDPLVGSLRLQLRARLRRIARFASPPPRP